MLFNEPKLLKLSAGVRSVEEYNVSVLFNEPKLLKSKGTGKTQWLAKGFSALQRAEIAEMKKNVVRRAAMRVSVLFNEPKLLKYRPPLPAPPVSQIPIPARRRS